MSALLIALLGVLLVPLFVATWRTSLFGLACQGLLMAWIALRLSPHPHTASEWVTLADLVLVRGFGAPLALYSVLRAQKVPARSDVIPPNLLSWTLALGFVLVSFNFSALLVPEDGDERSLVAVAASGLTIGFLVLATQSGVFSQMIGALRVENAIALFELGGAPHHPALGVQLGQLAVFVVTVGLFRWYLTHLAVPAPEEERSSPEGPTL